MIRPGIGALVGIAGGEERGVRPAVAHGHAEALRAADRHVGTEVAGRRQQHEAQQIGRHDRERLRGMQRSITGRKSRTAPLEPG